MLKTKCPVEDRLGLHIFVIFLALEIIYLWIFISLFPALAARIRVNRIRILNANLKYRRHKQSSVSTGTVFIPFKARWMVPLNCNHVAQELWMVAATYGFVSAFGQNIALIPTLTTGTQIEHSCTFNCTMYNVRACIIGMKIVLRFGYFQNDR